MHACHPTSTLKVYKRVWAWQPERDLHLYYSSRNKWGRRPDLNMGRKERGQEKGVSEWWMLNSSLIWMKNKLYSFVGSLCIHFWLNVESAMREDKVWEQRFNIASKPFRRMVLSVLYLGLNEALRSLLLPRSLHIPPPKTNLISAHHAVDKSNKLTALPLVWWKRERCSTTYLFIQSVSNSSVKTALKAALWIYK